MTKFFFLLFVAMLSWLFASSRFNDIKVTIDYNDSRTASGSFKFKRVPSPSKTDAAASAKLALVVGRRDPNGAELTALIDGLVPSSEDDPQSNFFFNAGSDGGRFRIDLGRAVEIEQVNSYSWHPSARGPQVYNLFASDGGSADFNLAPDEKTHPGNCGWTQIVTVDTRPRSGRGGGQHAASVTSGSGSLGKYRYLLFDSVPSEYDDAFGNTFFSEVDVIEKK